MTTTRAPFEDYAQAAAQLLGRGPAGDGAGVCERLADHLAPIIGRLGVETIYTRGLRLASRDFAWLADAVPVVDGSPWERLRACLHDREPEVARQATARLLAEILALYVALIGSGLTGRLLAELWPELLLFDRSKEST